MNDLNRERHDSEIERLQEALKNLEPTSSEYKDVLHNYDILVKAANDDDESQAKIQLERFKIDAETDKVNSEEKKQKWILAASFVGTAVTSVTSIVVYAMICISNKRQVHDVLFFEQNGFARTSQSMKDLIKPPMHKV